MGVYALRELCWASENGLAPNAANPSANTWAHRFPILSFDVASPRQSRDTDGSMQNRLAESRPGFLGTRTAEIGFTTYWDGGIQSDLSSTYLLERIGTLGSSYAASVTSATDAATFTAGSNFAAQGAVARVGVKGDGRGDGQAAVFATYSWSSPTASLGLATALPATPATSDPIVYAHNIWINDQAETWSSSRFLIAFVEAGAQYHFMGCFPRRLDFTISAGSLPTVRYAYSAAYWDRVAVTTPSDLDLHDGYVSPVCGGSVVLQDVGTTARSTIAPIETTLSIEIERLEGHGPAPGQAAYQTMWNVTKGRHVVAASFLVPWSTANDQFYSADGGATQHKQILVTSNAVNGRSVGFYLPRAYPIGDRPTFEDRNGLAYQRLTFRAREGTDTTSALTRSAVRLFMS